MLDAVAELLGVADILRGHAGDALGVHALEVERHAERDGGEDRELVRGVHPLDVEGGVGFRVAEPLRLAEHVGERGATITHLGQDEVAGAVDDPGEPLDAVPGQPFAQRLDDRDPAGHRGFERDHHPAGVGGLEDRVAVHGDEGLVGRDHVLAATNRLEDEPAGRIGAADELDDDVDVGIAHDLARIGGESDALGGADARPVERPDRGPRDHDVAAGPARDLLAVASQHVDGAAADRSEAEHSDANRGHAPDLRCATPAGRSDHGARRTQVLMSIMKDPLSCRPSSPGRLDELGKASSRPD